ncbi:hypothetical protein F0562_026517 [Nyssa sinensis]|uniref:Uncharacterized protein n=1 Tax=Nyssa sinensis TaxID=561372 RepID=A0A5J5B991_9ASTE|nr:hypothetical protein F0562_026517 [Nyssa sinensis]
MPPSIGESQEVDGGISEGEEIDSEIETAGFREDASAAANVRESEEAAQLVVVEKEIKRDIEVLNANYMEVEECAGTVMGMKVKEEVVVKQNVETVIEDRMNVNTENGIEGNGVAEE